MARPRDSREPLPPLTTGRVVASHGREVRVTAPDGTRLSCRLHGRKLEAVCGDEVRYGHASPGDAQGTVYEILPRRKTLYRLTGLGRSEPVVANLTQLVAVAATLPRAGLQAIATAFTALARNDMVFGPDDDGFVVRFADGHGVRRARAVPRRRPWRSCSRPCRWARAG